MEGCHIFGFQRNYGLLGSPESREDYELVFVAHRLLLGPPSTYKTVSWIAYRGKLEEVLKMPKDFIEKFLPPLKFLWRQHKLSLSSRQHLP